jgi:hypothetical protein
MQPLDTRLSLLREGRLSDDELIVTLQDLGESPLINRPLVQADLIKLMSHPNAIVRYNSLGALAYHGLAIDWDDQFGRELLSAMDIMLRLDEDQDCRRQAAGAFGSLFRCTNNAGVIDALARVCLNEEEMDDVQAFAYNAILNIACVPLPRQPNPIGLRLGPVELEQVMRMMSKRPESARLL